MARGRKKSGPSPLSKYTKEEIKQKRDELRGLLQNYYKWKSLAESEGLFSITYKGEEYHLLDVLEGLDQLTPRQREAVELTCLENLSGWEAAQKMGFTKWSTPVQQYTDKGLTRMLEYREMKRAEFEDA